MNTLTQSQALVYAFLEQTPRTRRIMQACAKLAEGRIGEHQDAAIRPMLVVLERHGYAFTTEGVYWLTALGKTTREAFESVQEAAKEVRHG
jgi:hypothetical protein